MIGIDISSNNHPLNTSFDYNSIFNYLKSKDPDVFVAIKATQNTTYTNPYLDRDYNGFKEAGVTNFILYHFLDNTIGDVQSQLEYFNSVKSQYPKVLCALDVEQIQLYHWTPNGVASLLPSFDLLYANVSTMTMLTASIKIPQSKMWLANPSNIKTGYSPSIIQEIAIEIPGSVGLFDYNTALSPNIFQTLSTSSTNPINNFNNLTNLNNPTIKDIGNIMIARTYKATTDANGDGWLMIPQTNDEIISITAEGSYPPVDGYWKLPSIGHQARALSASEQTCISFIGGNPNSTFELTVVTTV